MALIEVSCPVTNLRGHVCGAHLCDVDDTTTGRVIVRCRENHHDGAKRILELNIANGIVNYNEVKNSRNYISAAIMVHSDKSTDITD